MTCLTGKLRVALPQNSVRSPSDRQARKLHQSADEAERSHFAKMEALRGCQGTHEVSRQFSPCGEMTVVPSRAQNADHQEKDDFEQTIPWHCERRTISSVGTNPCPDITRHLGSPPNTIEASCGSSENIQIESKSGPSLRALLTYQSSGKTHAPFSHSRKSPRLKCIPNMRLPFAASNSAIACGLGVRNLRGLLMPSRDAS